MNEEQRYLFDTFGYFVLDNAVNDEQLQQLRGTLKQSTEQFEPISKEAGPLHWDKIWRDLLDLPTISPLLETLVGNHEFLEARRQRTGKTPLPTFRLDHINVHTHVKKGFEGMTLHGGWKSTGGSQFFRYHDGHFYNGLVVVAIELYDTHPNDGGFCCIPGSHKANLSVPEKWRTLSEGIHPAVKRIPAKAGDAIIFTEALVHGTLPWEVDATRKTIFYKFSPHGTTWSADYFDPEDFRDYNDMDDRKMAILEPPNARYMGRPTRPLRKE